MKQIIIGLILLMPITKFSIVMANERLDVNNSVQIQAERGLQPRS